MNLVDVRRLTMRFGGVHALENIDLSIKTGEIRGLIGPNGSGKTTLFNAMTGVYRPTGGEVHIEGHRISGLSPHAITEKGIGRTFQNIRLFSDLSVLENVMVGRHCRSKSGFFGAVLRPRWVGEEEQEIINRSMSILQFLRLDNRWSDKPSNLPYGQQRLLEIARALATQPKLLLLDEPSAGMNPKETESLMSLMVELREQGYTLMIVEHDMRLIMSICDVITVLNFGLKISEGTPTQIQNDNRVIEAYLGRSK